MTLLKFTLCFAAIALHAQEANLIFEVASIRPTQETGGNSGINQKNGGMSTHNAKVIQLLQFAYSVQNYQIIGGPGWMRTDGYDIVAKFEQAEGAVKLSSKAETAETKARLRSLLSDRFQLKLREESKELPIYAITIGKNGHKLKAVDVGAGASMHSSSQSNGNGSLSAQRTTLKGLGDLLGNVLGRPVTNETGLDGTFDFEMKWSADLGPTSSADQSGPSIFTALQEQLGLKLESKKGPVPTFVIERLERPSEN